MLLGWLLCSSPRCSGKNREFGVCWQFPPEQRGVVTVQQKRRLSRRSFRPLDAAVTPDD